MGASCSQGGSKPTVRILVSSYHGSVPVEDKYGVSEPAALTGGSKAPKKGTAAISGGDQAVYTDVSLSNHSLSLNCITSEPMGKAAGLDRGLSYIRFQCHVSARSARMIACIHQYTCILFIRVTSSCQYAPGSGLHSFESLRTSPTLRRAPTY